MTEFINAIQMNFRLCGVNLMRCCAQSSCFVPAVTSTVHVDGKLRHLSSPATVYADSPSFDARVNVTALEATL